MVTKQQQLERMATMWDSWPGINFNTVRMSSQIAGSYNYGMGYHTITREEWQQERDKMQKQGEKADSWHERGERPPVGATVEKKCKSATIWTEIEIVAAGNQLVIFGYPSGEEAFGEWSDYDFRPLRTEREKAIDEMISVTLAVINQDTQRQMFGMLYDAGYRKEQSK